MLICIIRVIVFVLQIMTLTVYVQSLVNLTTANYSNALDQRMMIFHVNVWTTLILMDALKSNAQVVMIMDNVFVLVQKTNPLHV